MFPPVTDRIPHRPPFLFVDEIVAESPEGLTARRTWRPDEDFYRGHYPGSPITPGVLLCESVFQTASAFLAGAGATADRPAGMPMIVKINDVRFRHPVLPGDTTVMEVKRLDSMGGFTMMSGNMKVGGKLVMSVQFSVTWRVPAAKSES